MKNLEVKLRRPESPDVTRFQGSVTYFSIPGCYLELSYHSRETAIDVGSYLLFLCNKRSTV